MMFGAGYVRPSDCRERDAVLIHQRKDGAIEEVAEDRFKAMHFERKANSEMGDS